MHNSLKTLVENVGKEAREKRKNSIEISGIILGFDARKNEEELLLKQILQLKRYVKEFIVSVPEGWESNRSNRIKTEEEGISIKYIERSSSISPYSISVFNLLQKTCMYDRILFISFNHKLCTSKIEKLIIQESPLCTFLGQKGNFLPTIGYYDKWINRFNVQILEINQDQHLFDLFRISSDKLFLKLSTSDSIREMSLEEPKNQNDSFDHLKKIFIPLKFQTTLDSQDLVKAIALLQVLKIDIEENGEATSKFRIQQVIHLSRKFFNSENYFLAYQILLFLISNRNKVRNLPEDWNIENILDFCRRQLLEESQYYSKNNLDRFRLLILNDLKTQQLMKETDSRWIEDEIKRLQKVLNSDNIVCL